LATNAGRKSADGGVTSCCTLKKVALIDGDTGDARPIRLASQLLIATPSAT
jgi:hypothetical protein